MFKQNIALGPGTETFSSHLVEIVILLLVAAILGFILGWLFRKSYKSEYLSIKAEHDPCSRVKAGLEKNISVLESKFDECSSELDKAKNQISVLLLEKTNLQTDLNNKMLNLEEANTSNASLHMQINTLGNQLDAINTLLAGCKNDVANLEKEKSVLIQEALTSKNEISRISVTKSVASNASKVPDMKLATQILGRKYNADDLKIVEGIGPKIEELLHKAGIKTWIQLADSEAVTIKEILISGGDQFQLHDPGTWPNQARLAADGLWKELKELQDKLHGGK